jgi:hypothetical protein
MESLRQGAFAGLVRAGDHGEPRIKADREIAVQAIVADADGEKTHGGNRGVFVEGN